MCGRLTISTDWGFVSNDSKTSVFFFTCSSSLFLSLASLAGREVLLAISTGGGANYNDRKTSVSFFTSSSSLVLSLSSLGEAGRQGLTTSTGWRIDFNYS
jgi:hypothetical protein